jgi:hypothetical protein
MKREARLLQSKAINSLVNSIEHFNRPYDTGRTEAVLIFMDHGFEMLLKASILHRNGRIRERRAKNTIGFDACVRRALSAEPVKFLNEDEALTLQALNSLRDAAQHHLVSLSEQHLYLQAQAGLTLFREIFERVFRKPLRTMLPTRVLPLSTTPPVDVEALFDNEVASIKRLLRPKSRQAVEAQAKLRALAIIDHAVRGEKLQPGQSELDGLAAQLKRGTHWKTIFPGVAAMNITTKGYGPSFDLRITKKEGMPVCLVPEGTPGASVVGIRKINELGFYNMGRDDLARQVNLTGPKATAMIRFLNLQSDSESYKQFVVGKMTLGRYSPKAVEKIREALKTTDIATVWNSHGSHWRKKTAQG